MKLKFFILTFLTLTVLNTSANNNKLIYADDFEGNNSEWKLPPNAKIVENLGRNYSRALQIKLNKKIKYGFAKLKLKLIPGHSYKISVFIKTENVTGKGSGATMGIEFNRKGKWLSGVYLNGQKGTGEYKKYSARFKVPQKADETQVALFITRRMSGTAWFDNLTVEEKSGYAYIITPTNGIIDTDNPQLKLALKTSSKAFDKKVKLELLENNKVIQSHTKNFSEEPLPVEFKKLSAGKIYQLNLQVVTGNKVIFSNSFLLKAISKQQRKNSLTSCFVDNYGRTVVNNELFIPIGFYTHDLSKADIDKIAASGQFNTIMPYGSLRLCFDKANKRSITGIRNVLDYCSQKNLKILFNLKDIYSGTRWGKTTWGKVKGEKEIIKQIIGNFKNHPAILGWYINDEYPMDMLSRIAKRHNLINKLDSNHPTWSVVARPETISYYATATDIHGCDPYPIGKAEGLKEAEIAIREMRKTFKPYWAVIQTFDFDKYFPKRYKTARYPTQQDILALSLLHATNGAKGFMFFSYPDLKYSKKGRNFAKNFREVCEVAKTLKTLEPYITSKNSPVKINFTSEKGNIQGAKLTADNGKSIIILVACSEKGAEAVFDMKKSFTSKYLLTKRRQGTTQVVFSADKVAGDILFLK